NYTYFRDLPNSFVRDPERPGWRPNLEPEQRRPFVGGFNASYTYPDLNNFFLAAVKADGAVLQPSFYRDWSIADGYFGNLDDPANGNWRNAQGKYLTLRPRPIDQKRNPADPELFPYPEDHSGDVKNLIGAPGGNDSIWIDLDFPVLGAPDGRKFKPL